MYTAAWEPSDGGNGWRGLWPVANIKAQPGSPVGAVSRLANKLDVFVAGAEPMGEYTPPRGSLAMEAMGSEDGGLLQVDQRSLARRLASYRVRRTNWTYSSQASTITYGHLHGSLAMGATAFEGGDKSAI